MKRYFNTEGICKPNIHYMVRIDERLENIKRLYIDRGKYFVINRGRQYGKTTTLMALEEYLENDYMVVFLDFQKMSEDSFRNGRIFARSFAKSFIEAMSDKQKKATGNAIDELVEAETTDELSLESLFAHLSRICGEASKPVILMIDEVDSASNNQVFIEFLAMLRGYYLKREDIPTFHSVILAGVYDIKNLKLKMRPDEEHQYNSPWNIAAKFSVNMDFTAGQVASMLQEYENDCHTGMNINLIAKYIFDYTSGYPYLVSAICKILDEEFPERENYATLSKAWTQEGISEAVKIILKDNSTLFDSMVKQIDVFPDLRNMIKDILYQGKQIPFSPLVKSVNLGRMFGFLKEENGHVAVSNRIFEMVLLNMFIAEEAITSESFQYGQRDTSRFIQNGRLNMEFVLEKFVEFFTDIYSDNDEKFIEAYGRKFFLLYLKPIINGTGNYYLEAQTRDAKRTDVIVDYAGEQFIVELKIWHGNEYNERGREQLAEYLDYYHLKKGYLLSFNFNKKKTTGVKEICVDDRIVVEAMV